MGARNAEALGLSNAPVLPHVLRFNAVVAPAPRADPAPVVFPGLAPFQGQERAAAFIDGLAPLSADCGGISRAAHG